MRVRKSLLDIIVNGLCLVMVLGTAVFLLVSWSRIPDQIPAHYNMAGEVDRYGGKGELIFTAVTELFLYVLLSVVEHFPQTWNTGVSVTPENSARVYRILKNMLVTLKLILVLVFSSMTVTGALGLALPGWFTWAMLAAVFGDIVFWLVLLYKRR